MIHALPIFCVARNNECLKSMIEMFSCRCIETVTFGMYQWNPTKLLYSCIFALRGAGYRTKQSGFQLCSILINGQCSVRLPLCPFAFLENAIDSSQWYSSRERRVTATHLGLFSHPVSEKCPIPASWGYRRSNLVGDHRVTRQIQSPPAISLFGIWWG